MPKTGTVMRFLDHPLSAAGIRAGLTGGAIASGLLPAAAIPPGVLIGLTAATAGVGSAVNRLVHNRALAGRVRDAVAAGLQPTALMGTRQARNFERIKGALIAHDRAARGRAAGILAGAAAAGAGAGAMVKESAARAPSLPFTNYPYSQVFSSPAMGAAGGVYAGIRSAASPADALVRVAVGAPLGGGMHYLGRGVSERATAARIRRATELGLPLQAVLTKSQLTAARAVQDTIAGRALARLGKSPKRLALAALGASAAGAAGVAGAGMLTKENALVTMAATDVLKARKRLKDALRTVGAAQAGARRKHVQSMVGVI